MDNNPPEDAPDPLHERVKNNPKNLTFWTWLRNDEKGEDARSIDLDKRIPGFASLIAIALFLIKEFVYKKNEEGHLFNEFNFTIALQVINAIVLIIILLRGLKILEEKNLVKLDINEKYIPALENQFVSNIKRFFGMTLCLYFVLIINTSIKHTSETDKEPVLKIIEAENQIRFAGDSLVLLCLNDASSTKIFEKAGAIIRHISMNLKGIIFSDTILIPARNENYCEMKNIALLNEELRALILRLDDSLRAVQFEHYKIAIPDLTLKEDTVLEKGERMIVGKIRYYQDSISLVIYKKSHFINQMLKGTYSIAKQTEAVGEKNSAMIFIHVLELIFSNVGGIFLIFSFLILFSKTLDGDSYENSLLSFSYLFNNSTKPKDFGTRRIMRFCVGGVFFLTIMQVFLETGFPQYSELTDTLFTTVSGIFNAVALSLLIARFQSILFKTNLSVLSVLVLLYLYAFIQVLFGLFNLPLLSDHPYLIQDITIVIAFLGKCILYLFILWILRTDRLKYYFYHRYENFHLTNPKMKWEMFLDTLDSKEEIQNDY